MTDINVNALSEVINDKMDRDGNNIASPKLPVFLVDVQYPTAENGYTWYRKYSDGWVEQGGEQTVTSVADGSGTAGDNNVNLLVAMSDTHYWAMLNVSGGSSGWQYYNGLYVNGKTTSSMTVKVVSGASSSTRMFWEVKGMAAQ